MKIKLSHYQEAPKRRMWVRWLVFLFILYLGWFCIKAYIHGYEAGVSDVHEGYYTRQGRDI